MSGTDVTVNSKEDASTLVRPKFGPGMLLQHEDLEQLALYTRDLSRMMFRSFFGCGVVCGLAVTVKKDCDQPCITVGAGLALDGCGDPIYVPKDVSLLIDKNCDPPLKSPLWVVLCAKTKSCAPRAPMCADDDTSSGAVATRERAAYEIKIVRADKPPKCACQCEPKLNQAFKSDCKCVDPTLPGYQDHYDGKCGCNCGACADGPCDCNCDCVLLAQLWRDPDNLKDPDWHTSHAYRRFIRPVLVRDPQIEKDPPPKAAAASTAPAVGTAQKEHAMAQEKLLAAEQDLARARTILATTGEALRNALAAEKLKSVSKLEEALRAEVLEAVDEDESPEAAPPPAAEPQPAAHERTGAKAKPAKK
jgi:hypothetical protein